MQNEESRKKGQTRLLQIQKVNQAMSVQKLDQQNFVLSLIRLNNLIQNSHVFPHGDQQQILLSKLMMKIVSKLTKLEVLNQQLFMEIDRTVKRIMKTLCEAFWAKEKKQLQVLKQILQLWSRTLKGGSGNVQKESQKQLEEIPFDQGRQKFENLEHRKKQMMWKQLDRSDNDENQKSLHIARLRNQCMQIVFEEVIKQVCKKPQQFDIATLSELVDLVVLVQEGVKQDDSHYLIDLIEGLSKDSNNLKFINSVSKSAFDSLGNKLLGLFENGKDSDSNLRKDISLMGPKFALHTILAQTYPTASQSPNSRPNEQKKGKANPILIQAIRLLESYSQQYYNENSLDEIYFVWWMAQQSAFISILLGEGASYFILSPLPFTLKILVNKCRLPEENFANFISLLWHSPLQMRKAYFKALDPQKLKEGVIHRLLNSFMEVRSSESYIHQFFDLIESMSEVAVENALRKVYDVAVGVARQNFYKFTPQIKERSLQVGVQCITRYLGSLRKYDKAKRLMVIIQESLSNLNQFSLWMILSALPEKGHEETVDREVITRLSQNCSILIQIIGSIFMVPNESSLAFKQNLLRLLKLTLSSGEKNLNQQDKSILSNDAFILQLFEFGSLGLQLTWSIIGMAQCTDQVIAALLNKLVKRTLDEMDPNSPLQEFFSSQQQTNPFNCVRKLFYQVNLRHFQVLDDKALNLKQYYVRHNPLELKLMKNLFEALFSFNHPSFQEQLSLLISEVFTSFSLSFVTQGNLILTELIDQLLLNLQNVAQCMSLIPQVVQIHKDGFRRNGFRAVEYKNQANQRGIWSIFLKTSWKNEAYLPGLLQLTKSLMHATDRIGFIEHRPHGSFANLQGFIDVKIENSAFILENNKLFQKSLPSNTLYSQLVEEVSKKFNYGAHEILLYHRNHPIPQIFNSYTLQSLKFINFKQLSLNKHPVPRIAQAPLKVNDQVNPDFIDVLKEVFQIFAVENKMGPREAINFIEAATKSQIHSKDRRIATLMDYSPRQDQLLDEEDFIRFYKDAIGNSDRQVNIWTNLQNLGFRKDLRRTNDPVKYLTTESMLRNRLITSQNAYHFFFELTQSPNPHLEYLSKDLLMRMPTSICMKREVSMGIKLPLDQSLFKLKYHLVSLKSCILGEQDNLCRKIRDERAAVGTEKCENNRFSPKQNCSASAQGGRGSLKNSVMTTFANSTELQKLIQFIKPYICQQDLTEQKRQLVFIVIDLFRTAMNFPPLHNDFLNHQASVNDVLQTMNFLKISKSESCFLDIASLSLKNDNFTFYESVLALALHFEELTWNDWIAEGIFHSKKEVRQITFNFLLFYSTKYDFPINFFEIDISGSKEKNCHEWFSLLNFVIGQSKVEQAGNFIEALMERISSMKQTIDQPYNSTLNGYLRIYQRAIRSVQMKSEDSENVQNWLVFSRLQKVLSQTMSNENRSVLYGLMPRLQPHQFIKYILKLIKQTPVVSQKPELRNRFVGLKNLGSICYLNSILQQFFMIPSFKNLILNSPFESLSNQPRQTMMNRESSSNKSDRSQRSESFMYQLRRMFSYLEYSSRKSFKPQDFCFTVKDPATKLPIKISEQHDAHEFLNTLFEQTETQLKDSEGLNAIFKGKTVSQITCKTCWNKTSKAEEFYHLALEVKNLSQLDECFRKFTAPQSIEGYSCENCRKKTSITKQTLLSELPQVLIVNLMRIIFDPQEMKKIKVHTRLEFPQTMSLGESLLQFSQRIGQRNDSLYRLKGVVIHSGTSESGHYYSIIRSYSQTQLSTEEWYRFNDDNVTPYTFEQLQEESFGRPLPDNFDAMGNQFSTNAYILFYEKIQNRGHGDRQKFGLKMKDNSKTGVQSQETVESIQKEGNIDQGPTISKKLHLSHDHSVHLGKLGNMEKHGNPHSINTKRLGLQRSFDQRENGISLQAQNSLRRQIALVEGRQWSSCSQFYDEVMVQNQKFMRQLLVCQSSFFTAINEIYQILKAHVVSEVQSADILAENRAQHEGIMMQNSEILMENKNSAHDLKQLSLILQVYVEEIKHLERFYDLPKELIERTAANICQLLGLLPQRVNWLLSEQINQENWKRTICEHSSEQVRKLYQSVLNTTISVYQKHNHFYIHQINPQVLNPLPDHPSESTEVVPPEFLINNRINNIFRTMLNDSCFQYITKNIHKSMQYFLFWLNLFNQDNGLVIHCIKKGYLWFLLDLIMADQSPFAGQIKRQDVTPELSTPIVQSVLKMLQFKSNMMQVSPLQINQPKIPNQSHQSEQCENLMALTSKQSLILCSLQFYRRMMKMRYDQGSLSFIINFMCFRDKEFSIKLSKLFLHGLNRLDQVDDLHALLNNVKTFLLLKDDYQQERANGLLGIPQFLCSNEDFLKGEISERQIKSRLSYAMGHSSRSQVIRYVSSWYFCSQDKFRPALEALYQKRTYETEFQIQGITTLLECMVESDTLLKHVLNLPPPCYLDENYLTWIYDYANRIQKVDRFREIYTKIKGLLSRIEPFVGCDLPVLRKIIGKNVKVDFQEELADGQVYRIQRYSHETFVMENLPQPNRGNLSLPDEYFSPQSVGGYGKYFVQHNQMQSHIGSEYPCQTTISSLIIATSLPLSLKFDLMDFPIEVSIPSGISLVNYIESDKLSLKFHLKVKVLTASRDFSEQFDKAEVKKGFSAYEEKQSQKPPQQSLKKHYSLVCARCTFINKEGTQCQMCEAPLRQHP